MPKRLNCFKGKESPTDLDRGRLVMRDAKLPVIWVYGGRCSGKTSLCMRIVEKYNLLHIDCDNILRFEALRQSARGVDIMARLNRHERLPHDILVKLLREIMPRHVKLTKGYVLDNFPEHVEQAKMFEEKVCTVTIIFYVQASHKTMLKRYKKREAELKDSTNPRGSTSDLFYRPVAVHDVILQQERIETQLSDFQATLTDVLNEYAKQLFILDGEKNEEELFRRADKVIRELQKTYDIPDKGNVNYNLLKNFLVEKSVLSDDEMSVGPRESIREDIDSRHNTNLTTLLGAHKQATKTRPESYVQGSMRRRSTDSEESHASQQGRVVTSGLDSHRLSLDDDDDPHAVVIASKPNESHDEEPQIKESKGSQTSRRDTMKLLEPERRSETKGKNESKRSRSSGKGTKDRHEGKGTKKHAKDSKGSNTLDAKESPDTHDKRVKPSKSSTGSAPTVRDTFLSRTKRTANLRKSALGRYSDDIPDSTIASPKASQKMHKRPPLTPRRERRKTEQKKEEHRKPTSGSSKRHYEGGFKKDERY